MNDGGTAAPAPAENRIEDDRTRHPQGQDTSDLPALSPSRSLTAVIPPPPDSSGLRSRERGRRTGLPSGFRNGHHETSRAQPNLRETIRTWKVSYEVDRTGLALRVGRHLADRSGLHGVGWTLLIL